MTSDCLGLYSIKWSDIYVCKCYHQGYYLLKAMHTFQRWVAFCHLKFEFRVQTLISEWSSRSYLCHIFYQNGHSHKLDACLSMSRRIKLKWQPSIKYDLLLHYTIFPLVNQTDVQALEVYSFSYLCNFLQVNNNEMVNLVREPMNQYDPNAVKVNNVAGQQVGHIKRELAKALAHIIDFHLARIEGQVNCYQHVKDRVQPFLTN